MVDGREMAKGKNNWFVYAQLQYQNKEEMLIITTMHVSETGHGQSFSTSYSIFPWPVIVSYMVGCPKSLLKNVSHQKFFKIRLWEFSIDESETMRILRDTLAAGGGVFCILECSFSLILCSIRTNHPSSNLCQMIHQYEDTRQLFEFSSLKFNDTICSSPGGIILP